MFRKLKLEWRLRSLRTHLQHIYNERESLAAQERHVMREMEKLRVALLNFELKNRGLS